MNRVLARTRTDFENVLDAIQNTREYGRDRIFVPVRGRDKGLRHGDSLAVQDATARPCVMVERGHARIAAANRK